MINLNKLEMFDTCVDGKLENFTKLINPFYDQFDRFYRSCKETFDDTNVSVDSITFQETDNTASFTVTIDKEIDDAPKSSDKLVTITKRKKDCQFRVQPNKNVNDISDIPF